MLNKDYKLYGTKILNFSLLIHNIKIFSIDVFTERPFFTKSKISEKEGKLQEIGLLICIWTNKFADGVVDYATCVDKKGKRYNIELDNIRGFEDDFEK